MCKYHSFKIFTYYVYSGHIDPPFRLIDPLAGGNIPEGQPKNGLQ
jgi:hypothetical protein